ncbi:MAG: HIT domain-containing protein [Ignavibacteriaceae bacterium]|jgi:ATP adenylyltransferase|nr:HIT domain-containing protein [Ignavibacteriaceae bacterium]
MEKLWSPWRSKYIESFSSDQDSSRCIFCQIALSDTNKSDNLIVHKDKYTFTLLNLYPYNNGHLMVVPYRHTSDFLSLSVEEYSGLMKNLQLAQQALLKVMNPHGFNIGANIGRVAGAGIEDHIHFHIVPRWSGDSNFMPVIGEVKVISQDLQETKVKLIRAYSELLK